MTDFSLAVRRALPRFLEAPQLEIEHFVCSHIGGIGAYLLREGSIGFWLEQYDSVVSCPLVGDVFDGHAIGYLVFGE